MPVCPGCGTENQLGDRFCMTCGQPLLSTPAQPPAQKSTLSAGDLLEAGIVCPTCDTYNEPTQRKCINCGIEFSGTTGLLRPIDAARPPPEPMPAPVPEPQPQQEPVIPAPVPESPVAPSRQPSPRLHLLRAFGRAEELFPIDAPRVTVGRAGAMIGIPEDPFLAPIHLVLLRNNGGLVAEDPGTQNGVFMRARSQVELKQGDEIIIGSQRMMILGLGGPTTDLRAPPAKDTRSYGSPVPKQLFLALRVLHHDPEARARAGAVILRAGPVVSIGQKDCSINFPSDPRLAMRHVDLHLNVTGVVAVDTGSVGIFVRLRSSTVLHNGDELLMGEELFRVEIE
jgi:hypothetical protein